MKETTEQALGRTLTPYIGQATILVLVTIFCTAVALSKGVWQLAAAALICWLLYGAFVLIAAQYRVLWTSDYIRRKASGGPDLVIKISDITKVSRETASPSQMMEQSAPFKRITITGRLGEQIYVSLRHFRFDDIRTLLRWVHDCRPDLQMPKGFV